MSELLEIELETSTFECGGRVAGTVLWQLDREPRGVAVSLRYETEGRGDTDRADAAIHQLGSAPSGRAPFELIVPMHGPTTFAGNLIRVFWVVRLAADVALQRDPNTERSIVVVPRGALA